MNENNPFTGLLNNLLKTAGEVVPAVLGRQQTVQAGVPNVAGTAAAEPKSPAWMPVAIIGAVAVAIVVLVFTVFRKP